MGTLRPPLLLIMLACLAFASAADGALVLGLRTRSGGVNAYAFNNPVGASTSNTSYDMGPHSINATRSQTGSGTSASATAVITTDLAVTATSFDFTLSGDTSVTATGASGNSTRGEASYLARFEFDLEEPFIFTLDVSASYDREVATVELLTSNNGISLYRFGSSGTSDTGHVSGVLPAGDYSFFVTFDQRAQFLNSVSRTASIDAAFHLRAIPEPTAGALEILAGAFLIGSRSRKAKP